MERDEVTKIRLIDTVDITEQLMEALRHKNQANIFIYKILTVDNTRALLFVNSKQSLGVISLVSDE